jgi:V/A-type H+-transporting ATPase subunit D
MAKAVDGVVSVRSAAFATRGEVTIDMTGTKIMGIAVPVVTKGESPLRTSFTRGYAITSVSSRIDESADKFERILDVIIEYADIETRLKRLGEEIQKTNRRVNALEQITVPALREQVAYIRMALDERAREDLFRLKKVKKKIEQKKSAHGS